jgi:hypothetical protein
MPVHCALHPTIALIPKRDDSLPEIRYDQSTDAERRGESTSEISEPQRPEFLRRPGHSLLTVPLAAS